MYNQPKTIITYLVDGSPTGIKTVELSGWVGKAIVIPRSTIKQAKERWETKQPAVYFLFGEDQQGGKQAYIGEAENLIARLANHDVNKDFRDTVVAFVSKDNNLNKADVKFLEANAIKKGLDAKRYELLNSVEPIPNNLAEYQVSAMNEFLENIDTLISAIGYPILKKIHTLKEETQIDGIIYHHKDNNTKRGLTEAQGIYTEEGFLVLKGSKGSRNLQDHVIKNKGYALRHRPILFDKGVIIEEGNQIIFKENYLFTSPSSALSLLTGASVNGRILWKDKSGKTLDENERKSFNL